jgi:hypothetical protein
MRRRIVAFGLSCLTALSLSSFQSAAAGEMLTPIQTQSISPPGVLVQTDWGPGTKGISDPLIFNQFNPKLGSLLAIDITLTTTIRNDYTLTFYPTPIPTTITVATSQTSDPAVMINPAERVSLTDGPTVTLYGPGGMSQIFGPPATRQPVDYVQMTESSGTWSSLFPITNPNFIPPTMTEQLYSRSLTASNAASLFSEFIGTGAFDLPITATAFSSFYSSSGNGSGGVLTRADAIVTIQYEFLGIPEPSSIILLSLGAGICLVACHLYRRASQPAASDRL